MEDLSKPTPAYASLGKDMSCQSAFDYAMLCYNLSGQWNAIYRTGTMKNCSEEWADFWFCMHHRGLQGEAREYAFRDYYREKERKKYEGRPNSEDVWKPRKHVVKDGAFLTHPLPKWDMSDQDWQQEEMKQRKALREKLDLPPEGTHPWGVRKDQ